MRRVAYLMSRFPVVTETFILYEILELERRGLSIEVFPLLARANCVLHPGAERLMRRAHYQAYLSRELALAQARWLKENPKGYLHAWWEALKGNATSPGFLLRALVVVPRAALFARRARELGVEHVHAHWATHPTLAAYVIHRLTGLPYSFTCHAHDLYVDRAMLKEKIDGAAFIATISEFNRRLLKGLYGEAAARRVAVVRCGVDAAVFRPRPEAPREGPFTFICVASLRPYKGQRFLLEAAHRLKAQGVRFRVWLVGEGEDRETLSRRIRRLGLGSCVELLGQKPRNEVQRLLGQADAMILPSVVTANGQMEGIPVALMEALASELPVVSTSISGIPELVEDGVTGLLVPEKDPDALALAMGRLVRSPSLGRRLGRAGRKKVLEEFNLSDNVARLERLLSAGVPGAEGRSARYARASSCEMSS